MRVAVSGKVMERHVGGNTTYVRSLYPALRDLGVEARVLTAPGPHLSYVLADSLAWRGRLRDVDVLHYPADTGALVRAAVPVAATIHGLPPSRPTGIRRKAWDRAWHARVASMARVADRVITVSEFSARELHRAFGVPGDRIHVIPHGIDTDRFHPEVDGDAEVLEPLGLPGRFVLFLGSLDPRKNVPLLAEATDLLGVELVLAGVPCVGGEQIRGPHVRNLGPVGSELIAPLLRTASVLAFPSSHEGFGLPVLEAMASGTPVVISDCGALPEVAGGAAMVVTDLTGPRELAAALDQVLSDENLARDLRERGLANAARYRWERSAQAHHDVFAGLAR